MTFDHRPFVAQSKKTLRKLANPAENFERIRSAMMREVEAIKSAQSADQPIIPDIPYSAIADGSVSDADIANIKHRGCVIVRGVYEQSRAENWNAELGQYIEANDYFTKAKEKAGIDKYFSDLDAGAPQIFGLYWSKPQIEARQGLSMAQTKRFLNRLYATDAPAGQEFDPDQDFVYADRTRRREPGDTTLGLSPHMDSGSYERWCDPAYQKIYASILNGHFEDFDPWNAAYRTQTREFASAAVCSMFRTFQGWTALTSQGPGDGTLSLLPIANSITYFLTRALMDDVAPDDLCGATPGRALGASQEWHAELLEGMVTIPTVHPGDTVWWHPDVIHSVADEHTGTEQANVIYIGASPACSKNEAYARRQAQSFLAGESAPDFAPENYELEFSGRATLDDLTGLGRLQMAID